MMAITGRSVRNTYKGTSKTLKISRNYSSIKRVALGFAWQFVFTNSTNLIYGDPASAYVALLKYNQVE